MRKKILHQSSCPQSGKTAGVGELQNVEACHQTRSGGVYSPPTNQAGTVRRCNARDGAAAQEAGYARAPGKLSRAAIAVPLLLIRIYQLTLSPYIGNCCRFNPSCSRYAAEALRTHGFWRGSYLAVRRILRCNPFCAGGYDPVPPREQVPARKKSR